MSRASQVLSSTTKQLSAAEVLRLLTGVTDPKTKRGCVSGQELYYCSKVTAHFGGVYERSGIHQGVSVCCWQALHRSF